MKMPEWELLTSTEEPDEELLIHLANSGLRGVRRITAYYPSGHGAVYQKRTWYEGNTQHTQWYILL